MKTLNTQIEKLIDERQYNQAVNLLAESFGLSFKVEFLKNDYYFAGDKDKRDIYTITLKRGTRKYTFKFGQSINKSGFYAQYGRQKYHLPMEKINEPDGLLKLYVKRTIQYDFGNVKNDKIVRPIAPTLYDVLACLQKYDVGSFENFCGDFGYDLDSRSAKKTYKAVVKEYDKMCTLFSNDELEVLQLIN